MENPRFWAPRQRINVASLVRKVGEARLKEACPVLSRFLAEQAVLEQLRHLPDLIRLQSLLIKNFAKTLESSMVRAREDFTHGLAMICIAGCVNPASWMCSASSSNLGLGQIQRLHGEPHR